MEQEEFIIEVVETRHVKVKASCYLVALNNVFEAMKDPTNLVADPFRDPNYRDPFVKQEAGLSWIDKRHPG